jgi:hypothetical protein
MTFRDEETDFFPRRGEGSEERKKSFKGESDSSQPPENFVSFAPSRAILLPPGLQDLIAWKRFEPRYLGSGAGSHRSATVLKASRSNVIESKRVKISSAREIGTLLRLVYDTAALRRFRSATFVSLRRDHAGSS